MTPKELTEILESHAGWMRGEKQGIRADLSRANLYGAYLSRANLYGANLYRADLSGADLSGADLSRADLSRADLSRANLYGAYLSRANLYGANLYRANLSGADLSRADLSRADLSRATLSGATLYGAYLSRANNLSGLTAAQTCIVPSEGEIIGWKNCSGTLVKVRIPPEARRSNATGRKCRAEFVEVLQVVGAEQATSSHDHTTKYREGEIVRADSWDEDRWNECSHGIHFFLTREEAEDYQL